MKETLHNKLNKALFKRMVAIFIAVIFICGSAIIPSSVYATGETETGNATKVEQVIEDAEQTEQDATVPLNTEPLVEEDDANTEIEDLLIMPKNDDTEYNGFLYKVEDDTSNKEIKEMENEIDNLDSSHEVEEITKDELYVADSLDTIDSVVDADAIEYIEPNYIVSAASAPNDAYYANNHWSFDMMNVPYVWEQNMFGSGVTIAVLDSGKPEHEDIDSSKFVNEENFSDSDTNIDILGHGTAVIGVIAATYNNKIGHAGVMPEARIMPIKILGDKGNGDTGAIVKGINHAINNNADVINMSIGGPRGTLSLKDACERATQAGIVVVASSGNEADDEDANGTYNPVQYPAAYDCVVSVASVDRNKNHSSFSTYNNEVTVAAPGRRVLVLSKGANKYVLGNGTSFSSPEVAALAAMVKSIDSSTTTAEFVKILKLTSRDAGEPGYDDYFGYGIINFANVYNYMTRSKDDLKAYLSETEYKYNGKIRTPSVTVKRGNDVLTEGEDYNVSFSSGRVNVGTYKVTVSAIISQTEISTIFGETTVRYKIIPPLVRSLRSPLSGDNKLTVRWYSMSSRQKSAYSKLITGYQVRVARTSSFSNAKYGSIKGYNSTSKTIGNLGHKKKYYVQYRAYKTIGNVKYYSKWSSVRANKTK